MATVRNCRAVRSSCASSNALPQELDAFGIAVEKFRKSTYATPRTTRALRIVPAVFAENQPP